MHYSSTEEVIGTVMVDNDSEVIFAFSKYSGMEVELRIKGDCVTYRRQLELPKYT